MCRDCGGPNRRGKRVLACPILARCEDVETGWMEEGRGTETALLSPCVQLGRGRSTLSMASASACLGQEIMFPSLGGRGVRKRD